MSSHLFKKINSNRKDFPFLFVKKKQNSTIQNYIDQKLKLVESQQKTHKGQSDNTSIHSIQSKSSKSVLKTQTPNSSCIPIKHRKTESHKVMNSEMASIESYDNYSGQLSFKKKEGKESNEFKRLVKENQRLKEEIARCKQKIRLLEQAIEAGTLENYPIDITKCPKPMPYINNYHHHFKYFSQDYCDSYNDYNSFT